MERPFLTARWEDLLLLNFASPPELLEPLVPAGTELDPWRGVPLVSLVGFMFRDTKILGLPIPFHRTFEEVNLRFYVRREVDGETRRAVVFIRELVPRVAVAAAARLLYNEPYRSVPMSHRVALDPGSGGSVAYTWRHAGRRFSMAAVARGPARESEAGSEAEFITEHYRGYTRRRDGGTLEYRVEHPRWEVWTAEEVRLEGTFESLYGARLGGVLAAAPRSAFIALGGPVAVYRAARLPAG